MHDLHLTNGQSEALHRWDGTSDARTAARDGVELWTQVADDARYLVSNLGRVASCAKGSWRLRKTTPREASAYVSVRFPGMDHDILLHRLVIQTFEGPPTRVDHTDVRHLNTNKHDYALHNLAYGTRQDNMQDVREARCAAVLVPPPEVKKAWSWYTPPTFEHIIRVGLELHAEGRLVVRDLARLWNVKPDVASRIVTGEQLADIPRPKATPRKRRRPPHELAQLRTWVAAGANAAQINARLRPDQEPVTPQDVYYLRSTAPQPIALAQRIALATRGVATATAPWEDATPLVSRAELVQARKDGGITAIEQLVPHVLNFVQAHVARWGWFYPPPVGVAAALQDVRATNMPLTALTTTHARAGNAFLHARFHSFWDVLGGPSEATRDLKRLSRVVRYKLGLNEQEETSDVSFKELRRGFLVQRMGVSFFKPAVACAVYRHFLADCTAPVVWDPACGFGARLLGFAAACPQGVYLGNEPATRIHADVHALGVDLVADGVLAHVDVTCKGSEHAQLPALPAQSVDLVLTSPPYYTLERYYDEPGQCWREYSTQQLWSERYLTPTLTTARRALKPGGKAVINVSDELAPVVYAAAKRAGLQPNQELRMHSGRDHFDRKRQPAAPERSEPLLIFVAP